MATFHTTGIVLSVRNTGENDRRAAIYSREHGKLELFAKSARKIESKLSPHLESLTLVDCFIVRGRIDHLAGIERIRRFFDLRTSLEKLTGAAWGGELVDVLTKPDHPDSRIFFLLHNWLAFIENIDSVLECSRLAFLVAFFQYLGHGPQFGHCLKCKTTSGPEWLFSGRDGGLFCNRCRDESDGIIITDRERTVINAMSVGEPSFNTESYRILPEKTASLLVSSLLSQYLDRSLFSDHFLIQIRPKIRV